MWQVLIKWKNIIYVAKIYTIYLKQCYSTRIRGMANTCPFAFLSHISFSENMPFHIVPGRGSNLMNHVNLFLPWLIKTGWTPDPREQIHRLGCAS